MLSAALRHGTWKEHHLWRVLRGVKLLAYNTNDHQQNKHSSNDNYSHYYANSTPTQRLQRAREILCYTVEEGLVEETRRIQNNHKNNIEIYHRPAPTLVQHLLTLYLEAAKHKQQNGNNHNSGIPFADYKEVWSLLAWMERHGYHVQSDKVLDELETIIDFDENNNNNNNNNVSLAARRMNRLDYIKAERKRLLLSVNEDEPQKEENKLSGRRSAPRPRTDPH
ncbi:hypothetical protein AGDE_00819 [Angomonas deanei]|nr:hypothetical protein AGDE_00819 [Angomonas deanei]|eukprot:EPY43104.1 hypothetical protein AGDE_00819 [Angomonas deanei]